MKACNNNLEEMTMKDRETTHNDVGCHLQPEDPQTDDTLDETIAPYLNDRKAEGGRWAIWFEANDEMRAVIAETARWLADDHRACILHRYRLAELVKRLNDDHMKNRQRRYGGSSVERLARFFNQEAYMIYAALSVAGAYTRQEVEELSRVRLSDGRSLSYYHIQLLSGLDTEEQRDEALQLTIEQAWTTDDLREHVQRVRLPTKVEGDGRGRPMSVPRNLDDLLRQQGRKVEDFLTRSAKVWNQPENGFLSKAYDMPTDHWTPGRAKALLEHARALRRLAEEAGRQADEAEQAYDLVARSLKKPLTAQAA
jgi:hypothetical protein